EEERIALPLARKAVGLRFELVPHRLQLLEGDLELLRGVALLRIEARVFQAIAEPVHRFARHWPAYARGSAMDTSIGLSPSRTRGLFATPCGVMPPGLASPGRFPQA